MTEVELNLRGVGEGGALPIRYVSHTGIREIYEVLVSSTSEGALGEYELSVTNEDRESASRFVWIDKARSESSLPLEFVLLRKYGGSSLQRCP